MKPSTREIPVPTVPKKDVERVLVQEVPAPGQTPELPETSFEDTRSARSGPDDPQAMPLAPAGGIAAPVASTALGAATAPSDS